MQKKTDHAQLNSSEIKLQEIESHQDAVTTEKSERRSRIDDLLSAEAHERKKSNYTYNNPEINQQNRFNLTECCNCCCQCIKTTKICCLETAACCKMCFSLKCLFGFAIMSILLLAALYIMIRMNVVELKPLSSLVSLFW